MVIALSSAAGVWLWGENEAASALRERNGGPVHRLLASARKKIEPRKEIPGALPDFALLDHMGRYRQLSREADAPAVVVIAFDRHCPLLTAAGVELEKLSARFAKGVFWFLDLTATDARADLIQTARKRGLQWPILMDPSQITGRALGLTSSGESVILDPRSRQVLFRGGIGEDLAAALTAIENQKPPVARGSIPGGRKIEYRFARQGKVFYETDVAPVLIRRCLNCHHQGARYPPFFSDYNVVRSWSAMIRETLYNDRMPPFSVDRHYGRYANDISLLPDEKRKLVQWLEDGMPRRPGGADPLVGYDYNPKRRELGKMQLLFSAAMKEEAPVPPRGELEYLYFDVGGPAERDYWVEAIWSRSTNPRLLHHASLMVVPRPLSYYIDKVKDEIDPLLVRRRGDGSSPAWILRAIRELEEGRDPHFMRTQTWGIGRPQPKFYGQGRSLFVPKGYYLILETHYMGSGRPEKEKTSLDFYGRLDGRGLKSIKMKMLTTTNIQIEPNEKSAKVETPFYKFGRDVEIHSFLAHLHMRGRSIKAVELGPGGEERVLVSIPNYYYGWQTGTGLIPDPPLRISKDSEVRVICEYDNSELNPSNPDPTRTVFWGQTHDRSEMCKVNVEYLEL